MTGIGVFASTVFHGLALIALLMSLAACSGRGPAGSCPPARQAVTAR